MIEEEGVSVRYLDLRGEIPIAAKGLPDLSNAMVSKRHFCGPKTLSELHWNRRYASHVAMFVFELQRLGRNGNCPSEQGAPRHPLFWLHSGYPPSVLMIRLRIDLSEVLGILDVPCPFDT